MNRSIFLRRCLSLGLMLAWGMLAGCADDAKVIPPRYPTLPAKVVPEFLKDSVLERVDLANIDPFPVSNFGLVANLNDTGDSTAPTLVREYIAKELNRHRLPDDLLRSPKVAVVRVDGLIPPGARVGQWFDVRVSCLEGNNTSSLAHGDLYQTDLKVNGGNSANPGGGTPSVWATVAGPVFVNPSYALDVHRTEVAARLGRRTGMVMDGGRVIQDRPIILRLRQPQRSLARALADRIQQHFQAADAGAFRSESTVQRSYQSGGVAEALDEGTIKLLVPLSFNGDWEHFVGVVRHLYLNSSAEFAALKARQLADEAVKPSAPLLDISFAWEGLGQPALPFLTPLLSHGDPNVVFAAARAGAILGDLTARQVLVDIARIKGHPFQVVAVQSLGLLPNSPSVNAGLRELLDSGENLVRLEAYRLLARRQDSSIVSNVIRDHFVLDIVPCQGAPLIYASRQGIPRLAILAPKAEVDTPLTFLTLDRRLSISAGPTDTVLSIFYRGAPGTDPVQTNSGIEASELIARLGGEGMQSHSGLRFSYGDVVAIVQALVDAKKIVAPTKSDETRPVTFVLQEPGQFGDEVDSAPIIPDGSRPQAENDAGNVLDQVKKEVPVAKGP